MCLFVHACMCMSECMYMLVCMAVEKLLGLYTSCVGESRYCWNKIKHLHNIAVVCSYLLTI